MKTLKNNLENVVSFHSSPQCINCGTEGRVTVRDFSMKAMQALLAWDEVAEDLSLKPICNICYSDLREILIERADEITDQPLQTFQQLPFSSRTLNTPTHVMSTKTASKKKLPVQLNL